MTPGVGDSDTPGPDPDPADEGVVARVETLGEEVVIVLSGELDAKAAPGLRERIDACPVDASATTVLDLAGVTFVDSTGIGCLMKLQRRVSDAGGVLVARGANRAIRRTLTMTGLHRVVALID